MTHPPTLLDYIIIFFQFFFHNLCLYCFLFSSFWCTESRFKECRKKRVTNSYKMLKVSFCNVLHKTRMKFIFVDKFQRNSLQIKEGWFYFTLMKYFSTMEKKRVMQKKCVTLQKNVECMSNIVSKVICNVSILLCALCGSKMQRFKWFNGIVALNAFILYRKCNYFVENVASFQASQR